jgi:tetratricopeptide (TPR) repeat protein
MVEIPRWLNSEWWMVRGRLNRKRLRHHAALHFFQQVISLSPEHLLAQCYVGCSYMELCRYDDAVLAFERGLQIRSDTAYCHAQLGRAYMYLSKDREAIESLNRAFRINPKYQHEGIYVLALAAAYAGVRDYETSRKFYADAARLLPENADTHQGFGWALRSLGRSQEAEAPLRRAIALRSDDSFSHYELGRALFDMGRWTEAEQELRQSIKLNPDNPEPHYSLGFILGRQERFAEAIMEYEETTRLKPDHDDAYDDLGIAYSMLGYYEKAIKAYEAALRINPAAPGMLLLCLSSAYVQCQRWNEALQTSERLIGIKPEEEDGYLNLAIAYSALDRDAEAIEVYQEALRINPDSFYAIANLGLSYLKTEKLQEAVAAFKQSINLYPKEAEALKQESDVRVRLGETYMKLGNLSAAREQLRILSEADPNAADELSQIIAAMQEAMADEAMTE